MSVVLDRPVRVGATLFAALSRVRVSGHGVGRGVAVLCHKEPVAILWVHGGQVRAMAMNGTGLTHAQVERLCPGALAEITAVASASTETAGIGPNSGFVAGH